MDKKYVYSTQEDMFKSINNLEDGIYYIKTTPNIKLRQCTMLVKKLEDLPTAMKLAELEPYRYPIAKRLKDMFDEANKVITKINSSLSINKIMSQKKVLNSIFNVVAKYQSKE